MRKKPNRILITWKPDNDKNAMISEKMPVQTEKITGELNATMGRNMSLASNYFHKKFACDKQTCTSLLCLANT